jgi:3,4-dihydroxy 2-butanone 4-phosphate synthase
MTTSTQKSTTIAALADGETVLLWERGAAVLAFAAATASTRQVAFAVKHTSGFLQVALPTTVCERLLIPTLPTASMRPVDEGYWPCIGVDAASGITTGISAADRARTARLLADPNTAAGDLSRPGHVIVAGVDPDYQGPRLVAQLCAALARNGTAGVVFAHLLSCRRPIDTADHDDALAFARAHHLPLYAPSRQRRFMPYRCAAVGHRLDGGDGAALIPPQSPRHDPEGTRP